MLSRQNSRRFSMPVTRPQAGSMKVASSVNISSRASQPPRPSSAAERISRYRSMAASISALGCGMASA